MGQEVTQNVAANLVVLLTKNNVAVTGLIFSSVTASYRKEGAASFTSKTLTALNFIEIGNGVYTINFTGTELNTVGTFTVVVLGATIDQSTTVIEVKAAADPVTTVSIQTCILNGSVFDAHGDPVVGAAVSARVLGLPSIEQGFVAVTDDLITAMTNTNGEFFLTLVRLADVEIFIPMANYRRRIVVPNASNANLMTGIP